MDGIPVREELTMHRFFSDPARTGMENGFLAPDDARHALTVLRLSTGDRIEVIHGGRSYLAEITSAEKKEVGCRFLEALPSFEPLLSVTLFQGIPKSDKMDWIVQKATELGVSRIVPLSLSRCVSRPDPQESRRKTERWAKIAREAAKQSGRSMVPEISLPVTLRGMSSCESLPELNLVPWEEAKGYGLLSFRNDHPRLTSLGILIGPEGGIAPEEIRELTGIGFIPVTLGARILRTETAGLAAVSSIMCLYGEMERV